MKRSKIVRLVMAAAPVPLAGCDAGPPPAPPEPVEVVETMQGTPNEPAEPRRTTGSSGSSSYWLTRWLMLRSYSSSGQRPPPRIVAMAPPTGRGGFGSIGRGGSFGGGGS